jgi:16S rRNA (guanine527-N7)-methyltransferase
VAGEILARLKLRAADSQVDLPDTLADRLVTYYELLQRWNRKINLTSLADPDEAIDRLLLEPVAASRTLLPTPRLIDLGSGGGSPAIPLALALSAALLVMVESRSRKAAFLREAIRELGISAVVENSRFEELVAGAEYRGLMDVVSIRALKLDPDALMKAASFLKSTGELALFESLTAGPVEMPAGWTIQTRPLLGTARLTVLRRG